MKMWHWRKESFEGLKQVIELSKSYPQWNLYTQYCELKEKGLRKTALKILNEFIENLNSKSLKDRIEFTNWIEERRLDHHEVIDLTPTTLQKKIIEPTLSQWSNEEPDNPIPLRWINSKESLIKAIELSRTEQIARYRLFHKIIGWIDYNQHELEKCLYIENPKIDLALMEMLKVRINGLKDSEHAFEEIDARIEICKSYLEFEKSEYYGSGKFIPYMRKEKPNFDFDKYL